MTLVRPEGHTLLREFVEEFPETDPRVSGSSPGTAFAALVSRDGVREEDFAQASRDRAPQEDGPIDLLQPRNAINLSEFLF